MSSTTAIATGTVAASPFGLTGDIRQSGAPIVAKGTLATAGGKSGAVVWRLKPVTPGSTKGVTGAAYTDVATGQVIYQGVTDDLAERLNFRVYPKQKNLFGNLLPFIGRDVVVYGFDSAGGGDDAKRAAYIAAYGSASNVTPANPDGLAVTPAASGNGAPTLDLDALGAAYSDPQPASAGDDSDDGGDLPDATVLASGILATLESDVPESDVPESAAPESAAPVAAPESAAPVAAPVAKRGKRHGSKRSA